MNKARSIRFLIELSRNDRTVPIIRPEHYGYGAWAVENPWYIQIVNAFDWICLHNNLSIFVGDLIFGRYHYDRTSIKECGKKENYQNSPHGTLIYKTTKNYKYLLR